MPFEFRSCQTVTGKPELIVTGECEWQDFPSRAQNVVEYFGMAVNEKIDGLNERLWITQIGTFRVCISWDIWFPEVSLMAWGDTPDMVIEQLTIGV